MKCADVFVTITAPVQKMCPVVNELDVGTATITFRTRGLTRELHGLASYLGTFADQAVSHEDFTDHLAAHLSARVRTEWSTAGMTVVCEDTRGEPDVLR